MASSSSRTHVRSRCQTYDLPAEEATFAHYLHTTVGLTQREEIVYSQSISQSQAGIIARARKHVRRQ